MPHSPHATPWVAPSTPRPARRAVHSPPDAPGRRQLAAEGGGAWEGLVNGLMMVHDGYIMVI